MSQVFFFILCLPASAYVARQVIHRHYPEYSCLLLNTQITCKCLVIIPICKDRIRRTQTKTYNICLQVLCISILHISLMKVNIRYIRKQEPNIKRPVSYLKHIFYSSSNFDFLVLFCFVSISIAFLILSAKHPVPLICGTSLQIQLW